MSKHETPMIRRYWKQVGGTLIEEFPLVSRTPTRGQRLIDAVVLPKKANRVVKARDVSLKGEDVIVVQAKASRLGMYLMGQAYFSAKRIKRFRPASILSVALCTKDDSELRPLFEQHFGMKVIVMPKKGTA